MWKSLKKPIGRPNKNWTTDRDREWIYCHDKDILYRWKSEDNDTPFNIVHKYLSRTKIVAHPVVISPNAKPILSWRDSINSGEFAMILHGCKEKNPIFSKRFWRIIPREKLKKIWLAKEDIEKIKQIKNIFESIGWKGTFADIFLMLMTRWDRFFRKNSRPIINLNSKNFNVLSITRTCWRDGELLYWIINRGITLDDTFSLLENTE